MKQAPIQRRTFVKSCVASIAMVSANPNILAKAEPVNNYSRALLTDDKGKPINSEFLRINHGFVFHYPFVTTPCFIINIGRPVTAVTDLQTHAGEHYQWPGGCGPDKSVVAFAAICSHKLSYPTKTLSFLNYRPESVQYVNSDLSTENRSQLIYCCSERSAYDPAEGAQVLGGPASQPLAAIDIEYNEDEDHYYAVGTRGGELYQQFFERFNFRLALDHKREDVSARVEDTTRVYSHAEYSAHTVAC